MEGNNTASRGINYRKVWRKIKSRKKLFYKVLPITFILSAIYIFSLPRYYTTEAMLAPETENPLSAAGAFGSIASSFGIDLGDEGSDAITPMLYPDLLEDNGFIVSLYPIRIETADGKVKTSYREYLKKHQKRAWWMGGIYWVAGLFGSGNKDTAQNSKLDPYQLSREEDKLVSIIRNNISLSVDKKTGVITVNVQDQDARVCRIVADSLIVRLQDFIIDYRTNKARRDVAYYTALADSALAEYKTSVAAYNRFADANTNVVLPSYKTRMSDLENEMQLKYNAYTALNTQLQNAKAKVQERTPAFTLLKGAAMPTRPAGPKRVIFILTMLFLASAITSCFILKDILVPDPEKDDE